MNNKLKYKKRRKILFFILLFVIIISCKNNNIIYLKNKSLPDKTWEQNNIIKFNVHIEDTLSKYNFYVNIRNTSDYGFCNLFIFLKTLYPDGNNSIDTIEFILAGPDGKWLGKGKNIIDNKILLKTNLSFPKAGNYSFEFTQAMRENKLKGIEDIGIQIEKIQ